MNTSDENEVQHGRYKCKNIKPTYHDAPTAGVPTREAAGPKGDAARSTGDATGGATGPTEDATPWEKTGMI